MRSYENIRSYEKVHNYEKGTKLRKEHSYEKGTKLRKRYEGVMNRLRNKLPGYERNMKLRKRYEVRKRYKVTKKVRRGYEISYENIGYEVIRIRDSSATYRDNLL